MSRKSQLLEIEADEPEMLHSILSKLPRPLDLEAFIKSATKLYRDYPPARLPGRTWHRISNSSVLKTTQDFHALLRQTLHDGELYFEQEADEIRRREAFERLKKQFQLSSRRYRRPATYAGLAIIVAVFAMISRSYNLPPSSHALETVWSHTQHEISSFWHMLPWFR